MARKNATAEVSKSELVKQHLAKHADAKVKDVQEALASEGHSVSIALINKIKYSKGPKRAAKKPDRQTTNGHASTNGASASKAQAIRDAFASLGGKARTSEIVAHLAEKKIKVSPAQVSGLRKKKRRKGAAAKLAVESPQALGGGLELKHLLAAKKLTDQLGTDLAKRAIDALHQLGV